MDKAEYLEKTVQELEEYIRLAEPHYPADMWAYYADKVEIVDAR